MNETQILGIALGDFVIAVSTVLAVIVALFIGVKTLLQSTSLQKREYKARLLNEIKEWAVNFQETLVPSIPNFNDLMQTSSIKTTSGLAREAIDKARVALEKAESSTKTAVILLEGSYIRQLAEKVFKEELCDVFQIIDSEIGILTYLKSKDAGTDYCVSSSDRAIVQKLEETLTSGESTLEQLLDKHHQLLRGRIGELLVKIADAKAKLL